MYSKVSGFVLPKITIHDFLVLVSLAARLVAVR